MICQTWQCSLLCIPGDQEKVSEVRAIAGLWSNLNRWIDCSVGDNEK